MKVSANFLCVVIEHLGDRYGSKMTDQKGKFNEILEHLTEIERLWQLIEDVPDDGQEKQ